MSQNNVCEQPKDGTSSLSESSSFLPGWGSCNRDGFRRFVRSIGLREPVERAADFWFLVVGEDQRGDVSKRHVCSSFLGAGQ